jgi:peptidyl-prolyl cis-trans isomerase A (cyclophilin A)
MIKMKEPEDGPMKILSRVALWLLAGAALCLGGEGSNPKVALMTDQGDIIIEVFERQAPLTAANFLAYADQSLFAGASFYRVVRADNQPDNPIKIEVVQGGLEFVPQAKPLPVIPHETTEATGVRHLDGTVSMARLEPGSASSEFFICVNDQPELDFLGLRNPDGQGFAAFGRVIQGMDIVRKIQNLPAEGQMLKERVAIRSASRRD